MKMSVWILKAVTGVNYLRHIGEVGIGQGCLSIEQTGQGQG